jgi:hypothetical protein
LEAPSESPLVSWIGEARADALLNDRWLDDQDRGFRQLAADILLLAHAEIISHKSA